VGLGVIDRWVAVILHQGIGQLGPTEVIHLRKGGFGGLPVELLGRAGAEQILAAEDLEKIEPDVAQVGLIVGHGHSIGTEPTVE
jgi:hypothetical protein